MSNYTCRCCGYITLESEIHDICSICWWQDDPACWNDLDANGGANGSTSLRQAQKNYIEFGACDECMLDLVRAPSIDDVRDLKWKPFEVNR
ncbi:MULTISPECIES: CPCC family cysteine-rich protein [Paenibacillus]|uniref:CPCC family cysteine-rich protein n=1 Tax=Paenibacillus urinalis TaxID=521520 RepID=A0AAX3N589_9BACL|nr:CPCC family cysteine-rich protein [Paenibacillus urinalis]WDH85000.1 CPCC family cysteine-rich protein [Paenibacillus urinalis]